MPDGIGGKLRGALGELARAQVDRAAHHDQSAKAYNERERAEDETTKGNDNA